MKDDMLSALARGPEGQNLVQLFDSHHLPADCRNPHEHGVEAAMSGNRLNNERGSTTHTDGEMNFEYLVHLRGPVGKCTVNLTSVLAMAVAYCRLEQTAARDALKSIQEQARTERAEGERQPEDGRTKGRTRSARSRRSKS